MNDQPAPVVAVIDTSVLLSLHATQTIGVISILFDKVLVPTTVRKEVGAGGPQNQNVEAALAEFSFFEPCDDIDESRISLLRDTLTGLQRGRDKGEAEAIVQAAQQAVSMVLIDDRLGRRLAGHHAIECHGTLWIFEELRKRGVLTSLRPYFDQLIRNRRRQPRIEMNRILSMFGEETL